MSANYTNQSSSILLNSLFLFVARLFIVMLFLPAGINKVMDFTGTVSYVASVSLPFPTLSAVMAIIIEVACGVLLLAGYLQKMASLVLAVFTIVATFVFHAFWNAPAESAFIQELLFFKNIAVIGGLLAFFVACRLPHKWSVDGFRLNRD